MGVHGPLLQSLLSAGGIVQLESVLRSLIHEPDHILPEMVQGDRSIFLQWCYWRNTPPLNPSDEPGIEASVAVDIGPDNQYPTPTTIGNLLLDAIENNVEISWPNIPLSSESVSENMVWTVEQMKEIQKKHDVKRPRFKKSE